VSDVEQVLARAAREPGFATELALDPRQALVGYELSGEDLRRLADALAPADGSEHRRLRGLLAGDDGAAERG
jgi:hypothetical protein